MWLGFRLRHLAAASLFSTPLFCNNQQPHGQFKENLPIFSRQEIQKHNKESDLWITYKDGVYNITDFLPKHPGSNEALMLAAGGPIDQVWFLLRIHLREDILNLLESFRVGNVDPNEPKINLQDPFELDPQRPKGGRVLSERPYNAETFDRFLYDNQLTPQEAFYVRNHFNVPDINPNDYKLQIVLSEDQCFSFTLDELKSKFPVVTIEATLMCAGNGRSEMNIGGLTKGLAWKKGSIANALWTGVRLKDVLEYVGVKDSNKYKHVLLDGTDAYLSFNFSNSIPIEKVLDDQGDVLLAFEVNNEPLSRDHGFPIRAVVPGYIGVRWVKWLERVTLQEGQADNFWHQRDYKMFPRGFDMTNMDECRKLPGVYEIPVTSAITFPEGEVVYDINEEEVELKGYAYSGAGNRIVRVELTLDDGETWEQATINDNDEGRGKKWSWSLWSGKVEHNRSNKVCVRAWDQSFNTQPKTAEEIWNPRGLLNNSWHCLNMRPK